MNKRRFGGVLVLLGLLFITAAFSLYGYNRNQEKRAGEASVSVLEEVANLLKAPDTIEGEVVVLEDQALLPENTLAAPGSMPSYVREQGTGDDQQRNLNPEESEEMPAATTDGGKTADTHSEQIASTIPPSSSLNNEDDTAVAEKNTTPTEKPLPDYLMHPEIEMPEKKINGYAYIGTLDIPTLSLSLPVMSSWSYTQLNYAPCRYNGSAYTDDFVLIAHNYATHFGRIKELRPGDEVIFTDMNGNVLRYEVVETEILERDEVKKLVESGYALTLMTCTIGGRTRVTVRCDRVLE